MRDGFIFYRSFYESSKALNNEQKLELYEAIFELALNQNETKTEPMVNAFLNLIKPQIEANNRRFENGKKGGRPANSETKAKPNNNQTITKLEPKEKDKDKEKEKDNVKEKVSILAGYDLSENEISLFNEYFEIRKKLKVQNTESIVKRLVSKYFEFGRNPKVIENAIINNWKDFYQLTDKTSSQSNGNGSKTAKVFVPNNLIGKVFYNIYNQKCEFKSDGFWNYEQDRLIWDFDTVNNYIKSFSDKKNILGEINASFKQI